MNTISFLFAHNKSDKWSTPLSIVDEFKRRGWKTSIYSLIDKDQNYTDSNLSQLFKTNPDIIMHMDWGRHTSPILSQLRPTGAYCVMESGDDPQQFYENAVKAPYFDLVLSPDASCAGRYRGDGFNAFWSPHFADTQIYKPLKKKPKYMGVCSRGMNRYAPIIDSMARNLPLYVINKNGWVGKEHNEFLNSGRIVLQQSKHKEITRRIFEGMAAGRMVLTDRLGPQTRINELFVENRDIVYYNNEEDCIEKLLYYCKNDEEREHIAKNGREKVLANHTTAHRVDFIIAMWQLRKNPK
jgi:hypothetical protein